MGHPDTDLSTARETGDAGRPADTPAGEATPAATDPAKGSPAKGAHRFGDDGAKAAS